MRVQQQLSYVLHARPFSETSLLIDVFSRNYGRLALLGKGVRRLKSRQRGLLLPFQPLLLGWSGKGELPVLTQTEAADRAIPLQGHARLCGFYLNELLVRLLHRHDPHATLFGAYEEGLRHLAVADEREPILRIFELRLLKELGYALELEREGGSNAPIQPHRRYHYLPQFGARPLEQDREETHSVAGSTLLALARAQFSSPTAVRESKQLMRTMINHYLHGKILHSRRLFQRVTEQ